MENDNAVSAKIIMLMGVSGSGKTTIGKLLSGRLGWQYADADDFHSPVNKKKMSEGTPLTDADRMPWLRSICEWMDKQLTAGVPGVVSCSALKRSYRDMLVEGRSDVRIVYLNGDPALLERRMATRHGHFFPVKMLRYQLRDLEPPEPDENVVSVSIEKTPAQIVNEIIDALDD